MTKFKPLPTQAELHELFDYSIVTGELYWKVTLGNRSPAGCIVSPKINNRGYKRVRINNVDYVQHRVIWRWVTGEDPEKLDIDHVNNQRDCNGWHNLRLAARSQNNVNSKKIRGYYFNKQKRKYFSKITSEGTTHFLGLFETEAEARAAYEKASKALHGEFSAV